MWIALNTGFISVVTADMNRLPKSELKHRRTGEFLCVRARNAEHLRTLFPDRHIYEWPGRDYPARIFIDRADFNDFLRAQADKIDYGNFKSSVRDDELHDAYMGVWGVMNRYGHGAYKRRPLTDYGQQGFDWRRGPEIDGESILVDANDDPDPDDAAPCGPGCTPDNPCRDCINAALGTDWRSARDRYGPFDDEDDGEAQSHLRVPPK